MTGLEAMDLALAYLSQEVKPKAQIMDRDPDVLGEALDGLCRRGLMALKRPVEYGGPAVSEAEFRTFQEEVARTSGSLAFLQTQHQSAVSMISKGENQELMREYLPHMHDGTKLVGIGFSQLRRAGPPLLRAERVDAGYVLDGQVPWVTGWSFFPEFLVGASLADGQAVFGIAPLPVDALPHVIVSQPMRLAAMETAMTVSVTFDRFLLRLDRVAFVRPAGWIQNNDMVNIALQGHFAIGCALGSLDVLQENAARKALPFLSSSHDQLFAELRSCRSAMEAAQAAPDETSTDERLRVRAWAIELAVRCAHAAVASSSGAANSVDHPAQRLFREALVYTVSAQTSAIMEATLQRLSSRASGG